MALAFAQNLGDLNTASGTSLSGTFGSSTVSGNMILAAARIGAQGRTQTFTDSKSNTWASPNPIELDFPSGNHLSVGYALNITGGASHQITCSISGAAASIRMVIWEESGVATASALDKTATLATSSEATPVDSGTTAATTQADEWVFVVGAWDGSSTIAAGAGYGHLIGAPSGSAKKMGAEDKIVAATGTQNGTITVAAGLGTAGAAILTFKAATGGTTFNDSGSGTMTLAGTDTESASHSSSATGTLTLSGTATESHATVYNDAGTGTIVVSGTATQSASHTAARAGTVTLTGSGSESFVPPGGLPPPPPSGDQAFQLTQPGGGAGF